MRPTALLMLAAANLAGRPESLKGYRPMPVETDGPLVVIVCALALIVFGLVWRWLGDRRDSE